MTAEQELILRHRGALLECSECPNGLNWLRWWPDESRRSIRAKLDDWKRDGYPDFTEWDRARHRIELAERAGSVPRASEVR